MIEAIMVITLLAAASATGLILFDGQWVSRRATTAATNEVAEALTIARNTAVQNQTTVNVRRSRTGGVNQIQITEDPGPYRSGTTWIMEVDSSVRLRGSPAVIQFRPDGTTRRALRWTVRQASTRGQIQVNPATGEVSRQLP